MAIAPGRPRRADIQGLRAVAVLLVVAYHALPTLVPGGFVGVDVFFVISGFLITGLLLRELDETGSIGLAHFYARRIRRLLPAALVVTASTLIAAATIYGPLRLLQVLRDAAWATVSLANVNFGMDPGGYFATTAPSPFLHFWSLSVEEQFYLLWPLLLIGATLLWRRWGVPVLLGAILASSLAASVLLTRSGSALAYYSLATRAWELAVGGGLAWVTMPSTGRLAGRVAPRRRPLLVGVLLGAGLVAGLAVRAIDGVGVPRWASIAPLLGVALSILAPRLNGKLPNGWRVTLLVIGLVSIAASAIRLTDATPFPGWAAMLPTIGAALAIAAGTGGSTPLPWVLCSSPAKYLGDLSYSLYLWHWPVLVLGMTVLGGSLGTRLVLVALAMLLATLSYRFVERGAAALRRHTKSRYVVVVGVATSLVIASAEAGIAQAIPLDSGVAAPTMPSDISFYTGPGFVPVGVPSNSEPRIDELEDDLAPVFTNGCYGAGLVICKGGDPQGDRTVVLTGDSHAGQWWPAFNAAARAEGWSLYIVGKNGCPIVDVPISLGSTEQDWPECDQWQAQAVPAVIALKPNLIVVDDFTAGYRSKASLRDNFIAKWEPAATATISALREAAPVILMGAEPVLDQLPGDCLPAHVFDIAACSRPRDQAVPEDLRDLNRRIAQAAGATLLDPTTVLCGPDECPVISYNLIMYRDLNHLAASYAAHLAPAVERLLQSRPQ